MDHSGSDGRSGPRSDPVWEHFTRGERHGISRVRAAKCNYCTRSWKYADLAQMKSHIATDCPGDMPVKIRSLGLVAEQIGPPIKRRKRDKDGDGGADGGMLSSPMTGSMLLLRDAASKNLLKHKMPVAVSGQSEKVLMVKAFVCNELPPATIENKHFREWLRGISPAYKPSTSDDVRNMIVQQYATEASKLKELVHHGFNRITLTPSSFLDVGNQRVLRVVFSNQSRVEVIWNMVAYPSEQTDASLPTSLLMSAINEISPERFIGLCTDNDHDLVTAAHDIAKSYPWIVPLRCMAQITSNLVHEWLKIPDLTNVFQVAGPLLAYFESSHEAMHLLNESALQMNVPRCRLVPLSAESWSDCILSLASLHVNETGIKNTLIKAFRAGTSYAPSPTLVAFVNHADFWSNLASLVQVLRPIKTLMDLFETHDVTLADVYAGYASINAVLLSLCTNATTMNQRKLSTKVFGQMTPFLNNAWSEINQIGDGLGLLAYFCHPRYHKRGLQRHQFQTILRTALTLWGRRRKSEHQARMLGQGLHELWTGEGVYNVRTFLTSGVEPRSWLSVLPNGELVELGVLLLEMQPVSTDHSKYDAWDALIALEAPRTKLATDYATTCTRLKSIYEAREALTNPMAGHDGSSAASVLAQADNILAQCEAAAAAFEEDPTYHLDEAALEAHLNTLGKDWGMNIPTDEYDPNADLSLLAGMTFDLSNHDLVNVWKVPTGPSDPALMPTIVSTGNDCGFNVDEIVGAYV